MARRIPTKLVTIGAIVGTSIVVFWLLLHAREDPPRGDRGPIALPVSSAPPDGSADVNVPSDAP